MKRVNIGRACMSHYDFHAMRLVVTPITSKAKPPSFQIIWQYVIINGEQELEECKKAWPPLSSTIFKSVYTIAANWALATPPPFQTLIRFSCLRVSVPAVSGECEQSIDFGGYGTCVWVWNVSDRRCQKKRWGDACSHNGCWQIKMFQSSPFRGIEIQSSMEERKTETSGILHEAMLSPSDGVAKTK